MAARIGPIPDHLYDVPSTELIQQATGIQPEQASGHVFLKKAGFRSVQRVVLADVNGGIVAGLWPGELKAHAQYVYSGGRADWFVRLDSEGLWSVRANPHIAFWQAPASQRLYLEPTIDLERYVELWQGSGWGKIGGHSLDDLSRSLWPWLKEHGCATDSDDRVFGEFLVFLAKLNRPAHLRAGLAVTREWSREAIAGWPISRLAAEVRTEVNRVLGGIGEPRLPAT